MGYLGVVVGGSSVEQRTHSAQQTATCNVAGNALLAFCLHHNISNKGTSLLHSSLPIFAKISKHGILLLVMNCCITFQAVKPHSEFCFSA